MRLQKVSTIKQSVLVLLYLIISKSSFCQLSAQMEASLSGIIGDAEIVFLGEPTHGEGNVFEEKLEIIKFLVDKKGFSTIAFESPVYPYLLGQTDMYDEIYPIWTGTKQFQNTLTYLKTNPQLKVVGFDYQPMDETDLINELNVQLNEEKIDDRLIEHWDSLISEIIFQDNRSDSILLQFKKAISEIEPRIKEKNLFSAFQNINLFTSHLIEYPVGHLSYEDFKAWMNNPRDAQMAANLMAYIKEHPKEKIICWGASAHFMNTTKVFEEEELQRFTPMASLVKEQLPKKEIRSISFIAGGGEYRSNESRKVISHIVDSLSIEFQLKESERQVFDTKTKGQFLSYALENKPFNVNWGEVFDGLVYLNKFEPPNYSWKSEKNEVSVSGQVVDKNGEGVPYAIISSQGLKFITDVDGIFEVEVDSLNGIHVSSVGYEDKDDNTVLTGHNNIIIVEQEINDIEGVVVLGKRETAKQFMKRVIKNIEKNYPMDTLTYSYNLRKVYKLDSADLIYDITYQRTDNDGYSDRSAYMNNSIEHTRKDRTASFSIISNYTEVKLDSIPIEYSFVKKTGYGGARIDVLNFKKYSFLNKSKLNSFEMKFNDSLSSKNIIAIDISNSKPNHKNSVLALSPTYYKAIVYINEKDMAIVKVESHIELDKDKLINSKRWYPKSYKNVSTWFNESVVEYVKDELSEKYFFSKGYYTNNYSFENGGYIEWKADLK